MDKKIYRPGTNDILCGRGKFAMSWDGNLFLKAVIDKKRLEYWSADKNEIKREVAISVLKVIKSLSPPGRFLQIVGNEWKEIDNERALKKVRQALRENQHRPIKNANDLKSETKVKTEDQATDDIMIQNKSYNLEENGFGGK